MIHFFGLPYLRLTRDPFIHERCRYLATIAHETGKSGLRILDVGCGAGIALYYLERFCRGLVHSYLGIDMSVERLPKRWALIKLPHRFCQIDLDGEWELGIFDVIWCSEVMEHIINDERLFRKMASHLAECGRLVITVPSRPFVERMAKIMPKLADVSTVQDGGHVRTGYDLSDLGKMAHANHLSIVDRAWLSPCSSAQLRIWSRSDLIGRFGLLLMSLTNHSNRVERCAETCFSLSVSLAKGPNQSIDSK